MLRYNDPAVPGRSMLVEIIRHGGGARQFFTYRIHDGVPGRPASARYLRYLDCARAALEACRQICRAPVH